MKEEQELLCCDISFREGAIQLKLYVFGSEDNLFEEKRMEIIKFRKIFQLSISNIRVVFVFLSIQRR